jgi:hypothetical protein
MIRIFFDMVFGWFGFWTLVGMGAMAAYWFMPPVPWFGERAKQLAWTVGCAALAYSFAYGWGVKDGVQFQRAYQARIDGKAVDRSEAGQTKSEECELEGGTWNVTTGRCDR